MYIKSKKRYQNSAFTLIELAITITVIAVILASAMSGRSILHNVKLARVASDFNHYITAMHNFETTYGQLPGDINNAYNFFGSDCDAVAANCNGNGNGLIQWSASNSETLRIWQHLVLAKLITGSHNGLTGTQTPKGSFDESSFIIEYYNFYSYPNSNNLTFTKGHAWNGILTTQDARNIDLKMDDGNASTGKILGATGQQHASANECTGSFKYQAPKDYILTSSTEQACLLAYPYEHHDQ